MKKHSIRGFARAAVGIAGMSVFLFAAALTHASTPTVSIISVSPSTTIPVGTTVTFAVATAGFIDPYYSLSDAFDGGSLGSADLNSAGEFSWTPYNNDLGTHVVTVTAHDTQGDLATGTVTITVTSAGTSVTSSTSSTATGSLSISSIFPSSTVSAGQTVTFLATPSGLASTPTYSVTDSFSGSTVSNADINTSGNFSWTPTANDIGTHTITISGQDSSGNIARGIVSIQVTAAPVVTTPVTTSVVSAPTTTYIAPVVTTAPAATFTQELTVGSTGAQVTSLQELLTAQGDFTGSITGYYGAETKAAVIKFQAAHSIQQLGIVGPSTRAALNSLEGDTVMSTATPATTSTTASVAQIQSEVQSITTELAQIEAQIAAL